MPRKQGPTPVPKGEAQSRRGPKRAHGPTGPDEVRLAVLETAADLFVDRGVATVSMRAIASAADVQVSLIYRYIGPKDALLDRVLEHLSARLGDELLDRPLEQVSFERHSTMGRWSVLLSYFVQTQRSLEPIASGFNPIRALSEVLQHNYGMDDLGGRIRGAQIVASALGWRMFEDYLLTVGELDEVPRQALRDELTAMHRRLGATPWPSPPDPAIRRSRQPR
jgi:AcrR family transcriptional regulator